MPRRDFELHVYASFRAHGGGTVAAAQIEAELSSMPLDGVLGFLGYLSAQIAQEGYDAYQSPFQHECLVAALLDGFPKRLPDLGGMYFEGDNLRLPTESILVHERNLAWLANLALLHSRRDETLPALAPAFRQRLFRLLLILNDPADPNFPTPNEEGQWNLVSRRELALGFLRESQFDLHQGGIETTFNILARHRHLLCEVLPTVWPDAGEVFIETTGGVTLERYFEVLALLVTHFYYGIKGHGNQWLRQGVSDSVFAHQEDLESIIGTWMCTPEEYEQATKDWRKHRGPVDGHEGYDFVCLRSTPLVRARESEFVCPVVSLLFAKIADAPYFLFSSHPTRVTFQRNMGNVYQKYAHSLVLRIASSDERRKWKVESNPCVGKEEYEVADSVMVAGGNIVAFEHKAKRPDTEFLRGGPADRVLGPSADALQQIESGADPTDKALRDQGLLTQGMRQQTSALPKLIEWAQQNHGQEPRSVFPIITHLAPLRVGEEVRRLYLAPLISIKDYYSDPKTLQPQWLRVDDLGTLVAFAERDGIDLLALLREKDAHARASGFDWFLYRKFGNFPTDKLLAKRGAKLLRDTQQTFFPDALPLELELEN